MSDDVLTVISASLELGLPVVFLVLCFKKGELQNLGLVLFGSSVPWLLMYFVITISHLLGLSKDSFAYSAVWAMSLLPYLLTVIIGVGLYFVSGRFKKKLQKFSLGFISFCVVASSLYILQ